MIFFELTESEEDVRTLRKMYSAMKTTFTDAELYSLPHLEAALRGENEHKTILCVVAVEKSEVLGAAMWEYFVAAQCFLYTYLFIHPNMPKGAGLGRKVADKAWKAAKRRQKAGLVVKGIFAEFEAPDVTLTDVMSPFTRLRIMEKLGARQVSSPPIPYFQPPYHLENISKLSEFEKSNSAEQARQALGAAVDAHPPLLLGCVVTQATRRDESTGTPWVAARVVRDFLTAYYTACLNPFLAACDPFLEASLNQLPSKDKAGNDARVHLVPFECLQKPTAKARL